MIMSTKIERNAIQSAIISTVKALDQAQKFAIETRDIESLVVIADRWMNTAYKIKGLDKSVGQMIGFIHDMEESNDESEREELPSEQQ